MEKHRLFLLFGSNLGDRAGILQEAMKSISKTIGPVIKQSSLYESAAWGPVAQPDFLNLVAVVETELSPDEILSKTRAIEREAGPPKAVLWGPRHLDIDILFYDAIRMNQKDLIIPHPRLHTRNFTLQPLVEIEPDYMHPVLNKSMSQLLKESKDPVKARIWKEN